MPRRSAQAQDRRTTALSSQAPSLGSRPRTRALARVISSGFWKYRWKVMLSGPAENPARRTPSFHYRPWNLDPEVKAFRGRILGEQPQPVNAS